MSNVPSKGVTLVEQIRQSVLYIERKEITARSGTFYTFPLELATQAADEIQWSIGRMAEMNAEIERLRAELAHKDAYYAQFDLTPKSGHETPLNDLGEKT